MPSRAHRTRHAGARDHRSQCHLSIAGDFTAAHIDGDNSLVVATDTQKNTAYAYAKEFGIPSPEEYLIALGRHFVDDFEWIEGGRWESELYAWERIGVDGRPHDHSFVRKGQEVRTTVVQIADGQTYVLAGLKDAIVLKSTGSEFHGFPRDKYTTLVETDDRIMATSMTSWWRYTSTDVDFNAVYESVKSILFATFAVTHSLALQQTLYAMGKAVLEAHPEIAEIKFSCPNKHHFVVDFEPFGLQNDNEVFFAADRPYGLIQATIVREGEPEAPAAWYTVPSFA